MGPRASDSEGPVKNEEILYNRFFCVIVMIPQELSYLSQSFSCTVGSSSVFPVTLYLILYILIKYVCWVQQTH